MKNTKKSCQAVELDLEETVPQDVLAKLYYLCQKRKLMFPEGIVFLLEEASEPSVGGSAKCPAKAKAKKSAHRRQPQP